MPTIRQIVFWLRRLIAVLRFCRAERLGYVPGVAPTTTPRKHVTRFDTLRLCLIKLAASVEALKRKVRFHLPGSPPNQTILAYALHGAAAPFSAASKMS